ncbi:MAG TPA: beta-ketoacyl synthase N-terminal-like domain-containing protein [Puia sp.]|nr:beta-ketoacyl synthase N-terminal-like domain-containing protein [Puia sp.]
MRNVYVAADNIFSPLGKNTFTNMDALKKGIPGIQLHKKNISPEPFYASLFSPGENRDEESITFFERIVINSAMDAMQQIDFDPGNKKNGFILSSTKGNISLIENLTDETIPENRVSLNTSANIIANKLGFTSEPLVVSHACISGLLAIITGMRLIQSGVYENMVISGADLISTFIFSGFRSFQAISPGPCKPFDADRDGISLGEAAATVILSATKTPDAVLLGGGSVSNDANHISGPSRTGEELFLAIGRALNQAGTDADEIDFISAHGTATRFNDEMEAKAFHLASMSEVPANSLKGYYGHTLGAAGILESIVTIHSMRENIILPSFGFKTPGTEMPVNIVKELKHAKLNKCLKTASGFGGCNAAVVFMRN